MFTWVYSDIGLSEKSRFIQFTTHGDHTPWYFFLRFYYSAKHVHRMNRSIFLSGSIDFQELVLKNCILCA